MSFLLFVCFFSLFQKLFFQVMLSIFMGPSSLYLSLVYWVYPMRDYITDTGCYMFVYGRNIGLFIMQLQSFFVATFRYVCLFHDNFLLKFNLSPDVSTWCESFKIHSLNFLKIFSLIGWVFSSEESKQLGEDIFKKYNNYPDLRIINIFRFLQDSLCHWILCFQHSLGYSFFMTHLLR